VRWGLAVGAVYVYSTSSVFAEEPEGRYSACPSLAVLTFPTAAVRRLDDSIHAVQESNQPTLDAIVEEKRRREAQRAAEEREKERQARVASADGEEEEGEGRSEGIDGLADEADSQGAFNPETGEINWDCPCLGGMAHGPCGDEFKAAFSCFVYSNEEPKGIECIDKFKLVLLIDRRDQI
jgi:intermembrane space import and assembly protein 40